MADRDGRLAKAARKALEHLERVATGPVGGQVAAATQTLAAALRAYDSPAATPCKTCASGSRTPHVAPCVDCGNPTGLSYPANEHLCLDCWVKRFRPSVSPAATDETLSEIWKNAPGSHIYSCRRVYARACRDCAGKDEATCLAMAEEVESRG